MRLSAMQINSRAMRQTRLYASSARLRSEMSRVMERMTSSPPIRISLADMRPVRSAPSLRRKRASRLSTHPFRASSAARRSRSFGSAQMLRFSDVLPATSSGVYPVNCVNPRLISRYSPSDSRLRLIESGLVRKAWRNLLSLSFSASSARLRSAMSRAMPMARRPDGMSSRPIVSSTGNVEPSLRRCAVSRVWGWPRSSVFKIATAFSRLPMAASTLSTFRSSSSALAYPNAWQARSLTSTSLPSISQT
ncbi:MAG: hypothetical protein BWZ10_01282 [candidate division BRC1 bacterium ADurb.BinA364]|nr:MAG: hypothetical protein BWZ10_01282 [candidate division BRC1 bacterium ADurb.BinA364]